MKYTVETSLSNFEFWSGAKDRAELLTSEELDQLDDLLPDVLGEDVTDTAINDLFWFDFETVCELLGYTYGNDGEVHRGDEDEDEEDDQEDEE